MSYQPRWEDGREHDVGVRDCAGRYAAIRDYLRGLADGFTVLDLGAAGGYFCRRLHDDCGARCVAVDSDPLLGDPYPGITVVPRHLTPDEVRGLGRFDVALCLSVLHHHADWRDYLGAVLDSAPVVFVETASPAERWGAEFKTRAVGALRELSAVGTMLVRTPGIGPGTRPMWVVDQRLPP